MTFTVFLTMPLGLLHSWLHMVCDDASQLASQSAPHGLLKCFTICLTLAVRGLHTLGHGIFRTPGWHVAIIGCDKKVFF